MFGTTYRGILVEYPTSWYPTSWWRFLTNLGTTYRCMYIGNVLEACFGSLRGILVETQQVRGMFGSSLFLLNINF